MSIEMIPVGRVLRETVAAPYPVLVTRPTGAAVRGRIQALMAQSVCELVLLDFTEVECLDFSCADEVIAKLVLEAAQPAARSVMLRGLCEEQREAVSHVLEHHRLALLLFPADGPPELLGSTDADLHAAFAAVWESGPLDGAALAERTGWSAERAGAALDTLARHRLVRAVGPTMHPLPCL